MNEDRARLLREDEYLCKPVQYLGHPTTSLADWDRFRESELPPNMNLLSPAPHSIHTGIHGWEAAMCRGKAVSYG